MNYQMIKPAYRQTIFNTLTVAVIVFFLGAMTSLARPHAPLNSGGSDAAAEVSTNATDTNESDAFIEMSAIDAASKPVLVGSNSLTVAEVGKRGLKFRERQYVDGYRERGERNPKTDSLALGFLKNWLALKYDGTIDTNLPSLPDLAYQLANDTNCTDPLVLAVAALNIPDATDPMDAETRKILHIPPPLLERAVKSFENSKHRGWPKFFAAGILAGRVFDSYTKVGSMPAGDNPAFQLDAQVLQYFREALKDGSILTEDQAEVGEILVNGWGQSFFNRNADAVIAAVESRKQSMRWLALTLRGENEIRLAWAARGGGYADTVSEAGAAGFSEHLARARQSLTAAWRLNPDLPMAPCRMIYVSLGDAGIGEMRRWFDRTVAVQIDYQPAWIQMRWGLRPRWYGDQDSMMAFGKTALNTARFDTDVPYNFFTSMREIQSENFNQFFFRQTNVWPHLETMFNGYIEAATNDLQRAGARSFFAAEAYKADRYDVAARELALLNWKPLPQSLIGRNRDLSFMAATVYALTTGPLHEKLKTLTEGFMMLRPPNQIVANYKTILNDPDVQTNELTREYIQSRIIAYDLGSKGGLQNWIDFLPADTNLTGWQVAQGKFQRLPDGSLEAQADKNGHLIYCRMSFGTEFELRGTFEVVTTNNYFRAGIVFGLPQIGTEGWHAVSFKKNPYLGKGIGVSRGWFENETFSFAPADGQQTNSFFIRFQHGYVTAVLNDREMISVFPLKDNALRRKTGPFLVGLGAYNDNNTTTVRYHDVQIKMLPRDENIGF